jgi:UDP-N-acetylmuramoylalanine-D-glutamate ligase
MDKVLVFGTSDVGSIPARGTKNDRDKNKKVLLVGLGILGGGEASAKFLLSRGAKLTITDTKGRHQLAQTIKSIGLLTKSRIPEYSLGEHKISDFENNDMIVFNPALGRENPWVKLAKKLNKEVHNDLTLFLTFLKEKPEASYSASFEKFKNEFDRGRRFTSCIMKIYGKLNSRRQRRESRAN